MSVLKDEAVVLNRLDYSETSQVLVLFTREHGKVRVIAKGIKRGTKTRFAPGIDLLELGQVSVSVRHPHSASLAILTEWKQTQSLSGLREKLPRIHAAQYIAETTAKLTEDWDPHVELFTALVSRYQRLAAGFHPVAMVVGYQFELLEAIGSNPRLDGCVACSRTRELTHFSSFEGGMICRHCEPTHVEKWEVSKATLDLLTCDSDTLGDSGDSFVWEDAFSLLNYHLAHLIGSQPRMADKVVPTQRRQGYPSSENPA